MAKQSGLGDNLYVAGVDVSGDVGSLGSIACPQALQDVTGINKSAMERLGLLREGTIEFSGFFNDDPGQLHDTVSGLPYTDVILSYCRGTAIGNQSACLVAKQVNYDVTRAADGGLTVAVSATSNGYGLEWCQQLTSGKSTLTSAGNLTSIDNAASTAFGAQAYLQVMAFTGTSATVVVQDSADNSSFSTVTGLSFAAATGVTTERVATGATATIRRYVRASVSGTFSNLVFGVFVNVNQSLTAF